MCTRVHIPVHVYTCSYTCICVYVYIVDKLYVFMRVYLCIRICLCMCGVRYMYIHVLLHVNVLFVSDKCGGGGPVARPRTGTSSRGPSHYRGGWYEWLLCSWSRPLEKLSRPQDSYFVRGQGCTCGVMVCICVVGPGEVRRAQLVPVKGYLAHEKLRPPRTLP